MALTIFLPLQGLVKRSLGTLKLAHTARNIPNSYECKRRLFHIRLVQKTLIATKYADLWDLKWLGFFRVFIGYSRREELIGIQKASLDEQSRVVT